MKKDYNYLQSRIDKFIDMMGGSVNAMDFLDSIIDADNYNERISIFISLNVSRYFKISFDDLKNSGKKFNHERMVAYKLHKDVLNLSIRKIGDIYGRKESAVFNGVFRMEEIIKDPKADIDTYHSYIKIKDHTDNFVNFIKEKEIKEKEIKK